MRKSFQLGTGGLSLTVGIILPATSSRSRRRACTVFDLDDSQSFQRDGGLIIYIICISITAALEDLLRGCGQLSKVTAMIDKISAYFNARPLRGRANNSLSYHSSCSPPTCACLQKHVFLFLLSIAILRSQEKTCISILLPTLIFSRKPFHITLRQTIPLFGSSSSYVIGYELLCVLYQNMTLSTHSLHGKKITTSLRLTPISNMAFSGGRCV